VKRYVDFHFGTFHAGPICFSPDGSTLVVGDSSGRIRILNWADNRILMDIRAHNQVVTSLAYSPDGKLLASGSGYSADDIRLWDPITGEAAGSLAGHRAWICVLQFSGDGRQLFSGSADQTIGVWDVRARGLIQKLHGHADEVWSLAFDERRTNLISGCKDGTLARWEVDKALGHALRSDLPGRAWRPSYGAGKGPIVHIDQHRAVALWRPGKGEEPSPITRLGTNYSALATAPGRGLVACVASEGPICVWSLPSANLLTNPVGHSGRIDSLRFSRKEDFLLAGDGSGLVTIWDAKTWVKRVSFVETNGLFSVALSPDGRVVVLGLFDGRIEWWDAERSYRLAETRWHRQPVGGLDFSPDGGTVASASEDGTVALWDTRTRRQIAYWRGHFLGLHAVAFSPDGTRLAAGLSGGSAARLWDLRTRRELLTLSAPGNFFLWLEFSSDGDALLCGSEDGHSYQWRVPPITELDSAL
jgi:WD40 repeat protein